MTSTRRLAAVAAALALLLSGCTVTGQDGASGVAAEFGDHVVTNADIETLYQAWLVETRGVDTATRREVLTTELLRPRAVQALEELGVTMNLEVIGREWLRHVRFLGQTQNNEAAQQIAEEPSEVLLRAMEGATAIAVLARHPEGPPVLEALVAEVERDAILSPRSGQFSAEEFIDSVYRVEEHIYNRNLGLVFFTEYQHVNGLVDAERPWLTR